MRAVHEARYHDEGCFITLTYNAEHLPAGGTLVPQDFVKFMKRFRKAIAPKRVRFFHCGEYGDTLGRPHYHALIFGHDFDRANWEPIKRLANDHILYRSGELESYWSLQDRSIGFSSVAPMTFETAAYVSRYCTKKVTGPPAERHYGARRPEYSTQSRRPGLGAAYLKAYGAEIYRDDMIVIERGGKPVKMKPPRYYDALYEAVDFGRLARVKDERQLLAEKHKPSARQLEAMEIIGKQKGRMLKRPLT